MPSCIVIEYYKSLVLRKRLGSSGFFACSGISHVLPIRSAPSMRSSLQSVDTRLLETFHFSAICDVVK